MKDEVSVLWLFAGKGILSGYCGNGLKNAEAYDGYNKLTLLEMCSIGGAGLAHPLFLMLPCRPHASPALVAFSLWEHQFPTEHLSCNFFPHYRRVKKVHVGARLLLFFQIK